MFEKRVKGEQPNTRRKEPGTGDTYGVRRYAQGEVHVFSIVFFSSRGVRPLPLALVRIALFVTGAVLFSVYTSVNTTLSQARGSLST